MDIQQTQTEMAHAGIRDDRGQRRCEDVAEEQFLKDLYLYMKKRDTPIERVPHLGFKQIDLYLMFKTVKELGGYHQVTAQQLWKQVYNILGGNPRSTSAATCTRRHYEKLMLPYECHIKGLRLSAVQQPKKYHYLGYRKPEENGPLPAKRRPELFLLQNAPGDVPEHHSGLFPLQYHKFCYPAYPYSSVPQSLMPSSCLQVPQPYLTHAPPVASPQERPVAQSTDRLKDPLEHLRFLAKQYESSSGLSEPLNLSVKSAESYVATSPTSSFAPPSSNKNPKFLNKPSPLYKSQNADLKSEAEGDATAPSSFRSLKQSAGHSPQAVSNDAVQYIEDTSARPQNPNDAQPSIHPFSSAFCGAGSRRQQSENQSPNFPIHPHNDTQLKNNCKSSTGENCGRMEIEIPLSVFNNWLQMYGPQATLHGSRQAHFEGDSKTKSSVVDTVAASLTFGIDQYKPEDGKSQNTPSQTSERDSLSVSRQYLRDNYNPAFDVQKNAESRDVYQVNDTNKPCAKSMPPVGWNRTSNGGPTLPTKQVIIGTDASDFPQDFRVSKPFVAEKQVQRQIPPPNPTSALQLTPEEVMKLKKMISHTA